MISIGMHMPVFSLKSTMGKISLSQFSGHYVVLFSLPAGFTPVCTSELVELSKTSNEFINRNTQLIGINSESNTSNLAWLHAIKMSSGEEVPFPIVADRNFEVLNEFGNNTDVCSVAVIVDGRGVIRAVLTYPDSVGKNTREILRIIDALQTVDSSGMHTPASWQSSQAAMLPAPETFKELISREEAMEDNFCDDWYMCYSEEHKKIPQL